MDVFLRQSRLVKRRSLAKELCEDGAVSVNGRVSRAGKDVTVGDRLTLRIYSRQVDIEIARVPERPPSKENARLLYRLLSEKRIEEEL